MTTQASTATCFSGSQGRSYSVTATDDEFNRLVSDTGNAQLGFAQTGQLVTHIQLTYAAGAAAWRVRNSVSQVTKGPVSLSKWGQPDRLFILEQSHPLRLNKTMF